MGAMVIEWNKLLEGEILDSVWCRHCGVNLFHKAHTPMSQIHWLPRLRCFHGPLIYVYSINKQPTNRLNTVSPSHCERVQLKQRYHQASGLSEIIRHCNGRGAVWEWETF